MSSALSGLASEVFLQLFQSDPADDKPVFIFCDAVFSVARVSADSIRQIMISLPFEVQWFSRFPGSPDGLCMH